MLRTYFVFHSCIHTHLLFSVRMIRVWNLGSTKSSCKFKPDHLLAV